MKADAPDETFLSTRALYKLELAKWVAKRRAQYEKAKLAIAEREARLAEAAPRRWQAVGTMREW